MHFFEIVTVARRRSVCYNATMFKSVQKVLYELYVANVYKKSKIIVDTPFQHLSYIFRASNKMPHVGPYYESHDHS